MSVLVLCNEETCGVPLTVATQHKIFTNFCKPCGRKHRSDSQPSGGQVRNYITPDGLKFTMNDKGVFVTEDKQMAIVRKNGRFSLFFKGELITKDTTLASCKILADYGPEALGSRYRNYYCKANSTSERFTEEFVAPWISYELLGTRDKAPYAKSTLNKDVATLLGFSNRSSVTLKECIDAMLEWGGYPYVGVLRN